MIYKSYVIENNINLLKSNLSLFYGENLGLIDDFKTQIKENNKKNNIINYQQDDILKNKENFYNNVFNISLFEEQKFFFINQATDKILEIIAEIEERIGNQKFYFFADRLEKKSKLRDYFEKSKIHSVIPCYEDNEMTIKKIIINSLKGFGGLTNENINIITENCGLNRSKLRNEIDKIKIFFNKKDLEKNNLEKLLNIKSNSNFDHLKDEALNGNQRATNRLLSDTVFEPERNMLYISSINYRLQRILEIKNLLQTTNLETAISKIKPPVFWKERPFLISQAKKWSLSKINEILDRSHNLEIRIKSNSQINQTLLVKKLLVDICILANS